MLNPGEEIVFAGSSSTFHRSFSEEYEIKVSDRALYLPTSWRPFRRRSFKRIELESIESVTLAGWGSDHLLVLVAVWLLPLVTFAVILEPWIGAGLRWSKLRDHVGFLFLTCLPAIETLGRRGRSELIVRAGGKEHRFITPSDTHGAEKVFDRKVLRKVLDACRSQGVPGCIDRTSESGFLP